jgi:uncharacterized protein
MHAILIHGWKGWPENAWFPWLRRELEERGITSEALAMPDPLFPNREKWIRTVSEAIKGPDTIVVCHSLGCPAAMFALEKHQGPPIEQVVCVSGFGRDFGFPGLKLWFARHAIHFASASGKAHHWTFIHAKNDLIVPYEEGKWAAEKLNAKLVTLKSGGHFTQEEKTFKLPEALEAIVGESTKHEARSTE